MAQCQCPNCGAILMVHIGEVKVVAGEGLKRRSARGRFGLTQREGQIADMVVDGMENKEIANQFERSEQVIKNHLRVIYLKIGCTNRAEMVSMVLLGTDPSKVSSAR